MTKIRKQRRKKKYQYDVNRKRMNKKRLPKIESSTILKAWDSRSSTQKNFRKMGLAFDINKDIKDMNKSDAGRLSIKKPKNTSVIQELEQDTETMPERKNFRFSQDQVDYLTYLLDKYGDDYKGMSRDKKNYLQQTWKQLRHKINLFKSIPAHYKEYLKNKRS